MQFHVVTVFDCVICKTSVEGIQHAAPTNKPPPEQVTHQFKWQLATIKL